MNKYLVKLYSVVCTEFSQQTSLITGIVIGFILLSLYKKFIGDKKIIASYDLVIKSKDDHIRSLKTALGEKLKEVVVEKKDKAFWKSLRDYFSSDK